MSISIELKSQLIAETAKLIYYLNSFNIEINKEEENIETIKSKFQGVDNEFTFVLKPLMNQIEL